MRRTKTLVQRSGALIAVVGLGGSALLGGCSTGPDAIGHGPSYPQLPQALTLDIQVIRSGTTISLTNTTAQPLGTGTLWINAWYSLAFDGLGLGESVTLNLSDFQDRFGDAFRAGGFFATQRSDTVVLAQFETVGDANEPVLYGLVVVHDDRE